MNYEEILEIKKIKPLVAGFDVDIKDLNNNMFDFQKDIVRWALKKGRCALFEDTGLGKTIQQLEFANQIYKHTNKPVLILSPLAVAKQTVQEGLKFGIDVNLCEDQEDVLNGINITNYDKLHKFNTDEFIGVVLDESSILKSFTGATTNDILERFERTPYKLCCTATPSPNDFTELGTTAQFLGVMKRKEMLSMYFINDVTKGDGWRLKGHSEKEFYKWIGSWAMMIKKPSNLGYEDKGYQLPKLNIFHHTVESERSQTSLFVELAETLSERREARKQSLDKRVNKTLEILEDLTNEQCLIWCDFNNESEALKKAINGSVEVKGSDKPIHKEKSLLGFANSEIKYLVSKPSIAGFGMNWQNCNNMVFCGLSDSYEMFYQAIRRCYRFGQTKEVNVHVIISEAELNVLNNIQRKESDHQKMSENMIAIMKEIMQSNIKNTTYQKVEYSPSIQMII